jgi:hypothetical protein
MRVASFVFLSVTFFLSLAAACSAQTRPRQAGARTAAQAGVKTVEAERFPGADLGARINAADRSLGDAPGEIVTRGGGEIATQVVVSSGHTLRLGPGTYAPVTEGAPILLKPRASLVGAGWDQTIILESTAKGQFTVVSAFNNAHLNGSADSDLTISGLQIKGANSAMGSGITQAISLGNCSRCTVDGVWINGTRSIGIQLGASPEMGNWAEDSKVVNCRFTRVASQNLAVVNGKNILFENNRFLAPGQLGGPGSTAIDVEPNEQQDRIQNITIRNNYLDFRGSELPTAGNGILVQSASIFPQGTPNLVGPFLIEGNTIIGGNLEGPPAIPLSNAIYAFGQSMRDVTIINNRVTRTGQAGIHLEGTRFTVRDNQLTDVGGGGIPGFRMVSVTDSRITGNSFTYTGRGSADGTIAITGSSKNNVIRDNPGLGLKDESTK